MTEAYSRDRAWDGPPDEEWPRNGWELGVGAIACFLLMFTLTAVCVVFGFLSWQFPPTTGIVAMFDVGVGLLVLSPLLLLDWIVVRSANLW